MQTNTGTTHARYIYCIVESQIELGWDEIEQKARRSLIHI